MKELPMKTISPSTRLTVSSFIYFILAYTSTYSPLSMAQENQQGNLVIPWLIDSDEFLDDEYVPVQREEQQTSTPYHFLITDFFTVQVNVDQFGQNIIGDAANEPSIAIDPTNPNNMAIGWRQFDTISSNFRQAGYAYSTDAGQTWTFPGVIEPGIFRSDPVLDADNYGNLFYYSLSTANGYTCELFKSINGGATWLGSVPAYGGDKGWMTIDRTGSPGEGNIYCFSRDDVSTTIVMTRSIDGGQSFQPLVIVPQNPGRGTLDVGVDGELYAAGLSFNNSQFALARSSNAPDSFATPVYEFSTQLNLGGQFSAYAGPNPGGLLGQTIVACDNFGASGDSTVYVLSSVDPPGTDPLDVYFIRSTDRGLSWSSPVRVNDDPGTSAWQWFGTMSIAPNGRIDVIWLDTRDDPGTYLSSLYYSFSEDNGQTWSQNERLSPAFDPHVGWPQQNKMGDYFDMISDDYGASVAWAGTFNGEEDVYYGRISQMPVAIDDEQDESEIPGRFFLSQNYPNPFNPSTKISYSIPEISFVTLKVYDILGNEIATLVSGEKPAGNYEVEFKAENNTSGIYFYSLTSGAFTETKKMILLR
jgi:Secretion system C-terminal sorting domain